MVNRKDIQVVVTQTLRSRVTLNDIRVSEDGSSMFPLSLAYEEKYITITYLLNTLRKMVENNPRIKKSQRNRILRSIDGWTDFHLKVEEA